MDGWYGRIGWQDETAYLMRWWYRAERYRYLEVVSGWLIRNLPGTLIDLPCVGLSYHLSCVCLRKMPGGGVSTHEDRTYTLRFGDSRCRDRVGLF